MNVNEIRPIYEQPNHRHYGPVRRLWVMLEQLFADRGGVVMVEKRLAAYQERANVTRPRWDEHLGSLIENGQSEAAAQRLVIQQMLVAEEYLR